MNEVKKGAQFDRKKLEYLYASMVGEKEFRKVEGYVTVVTIIGGWFSLGLESLVRYDYGTRYYNILKVIMAAIVLFGYLMMSAGLHHAMNLYAGQGSEYAPPFWLLPVFLVAACMQLGRIWYRDTVIGIPYHSHSFGISIFNGISHINISGLKSRIKYLEWLPDMPFSDWWLYRFGEPMICLGLGQVLIWADIPMLGIWVMLSSLMLSIKNNMLYLQYRGRILDVKDAQIEQQYLDAAINGKQSKRQMAGFHAVPLTSRERRYDVQAGADGMLDRMAYNVMGKKQNPPSQS